MKNEKINDGGPAFPGIAGVSGYGNSTPFIRADGETGWVDHNQGLSVRDYFAARALQGLVGVLTLNGSAGFQLRELCDENKTTPSQQVAKMAYEQADAMIVERNKHLPADKPTCRWTYDERENAWNTQCDKAQHSKRNGARFCQYCGGQIIEIAKESPSPE